jgi:hypothetical protein
MNYKKHTKQFAIITTETKRIHFSNEERLAIAKNYDLSDVPNNMYCTTVRFLGIPIARTRKPEFFI